MSNYRDSFNHLLNRTSDGYHFLLLSGVRESWVRRVRMRSGTKGIVLKGNSETNVVYDVLFEGNSGHYSISAVGNIHGTQASFLRESVPVHHGFGVTSSAFGTVYHRSNQIEGPEGHGGYPQGTLFDLNEGDLSLHRMGGSVPHISKFTVFWNWRQALFLPTEWVFRGYGWRHAASALAGQLVDFGPSKIMRPFLIGLHGAPLSVEDVETDIELLAHQGYRVWPELVV